MHDSAWDNLPSGYVYEQSLAQAERLQEGRFYTPAAVCDLMLALLNPMPNQRLLEPACGAGAFLLRVCHRFRAADSSWSGSLYGLDQDAQALDLASRTLQHAFPEFASRGTSAMDLRQLNFLSPEVDTLGLFDAIIGNPPYVRHERMAQSKTLDKTKTLAYLQDKYADYLALYPEQAVLFGQTGDLYVWFLLQAATLLKPGGKLAFIISNSWLNTVLGQALQRFLRDHFHVYALLESACERWFPDAAINPVILLLEKKTSFAKNTGPENSLQLIRFTMPLKDWLPEQTGSPTRYWKELQNQVNRLVEIQPDSSSNRKDSVSGVSHRLIHWMDIDRQPWIKNWGPLLRLPAACTDLLATPGFWQPLNTIGHIRYPLKTGINRFFYLSSAQAADWGIDPAFLLPVVKSARAVTNYHIDGGDCDVFLFSCPLSKTELQAQGLHDTLTYIEWGEQQWAPARQKRAQPVRWPEVASIRANKPWYYTKALPPAHLLCGRFFDQRFFFATCANALEDQTFYGLTLDNPSQTSPDFIGGLLNASLSFLWIEFLARNSLGEGVLQYARGEMAAFPLVNPTVYTDGEKRRIEACFQSLKQRAILPVAEELAQADRLALDEAVLRPLLRGAGLAADVGGWRDFIAETLLARMAERQRMAASVQRRQKRAKKKATTVAR